MNLLHPGGTERQAEPRQSDRLKFVDVDAVSVEFVPCLVHRFSRHPQKISLGLREPARFIVVRILWGNNYT